MLTVSLPLWVLPGLLYFSSIWWFYLIFPASAVFHEYSCAPCCLVVPIGNQLSSSLTHCTVMGRVQWVRQAASGPLHFPHIGDGEQGGNSPGAGPIERTMVHPVVWAWNSHEQEPCWNFPNPPHTQLLLLISCYWAHTIISAQSSLTAASPLSLFIFPTQA